MTSEPSFAYCEVVNVISHCCCERACAEIKRDLNRAGPVTIETLDHHCGAPQNQSLWQTELQHSQEDEQKVHRSEEHTSELQSRLHLVCRLLLEKKKKKKKKRSHET